MLLVVNSLPLTERVGLSAAVSLCTASVDVALHDQTGIE